MKRRTAWALVLAAAIGAGVLLTTWSTSPRVAGDRGPLLLVPMFNLTDPCLSPGPELKAPVEPGCVKEGGSAAALVATTLDPLGPTQSPNGRFELGYTLQFPLLRLLKSQGDDWVVDQPLVDRLARALQDSDRPAIVYLFSTHFGVAAPIEPVLARDVANLAVTPAGPLGPDRYYDIDVYPWTVARFDNGITRRREQAIDAVVAALCRLPTSARARIRGITLLGELHQLFPDFQSGMGFSGPYRVSDYSPASVEGFRRFLSGRFQSIEALNRALGADYPDFDAVTPPSKDIRRQPLGRYTEHIDAYAQGTLPVSGWVQLPPKPGSPGETGWVRIYRNGEPVGRTRVGLSRQDVVAAHPEFGSADVGWRIDLDFSSWPAGLHRIDAILEGTDGGMVHLATRRVAVMDRAQSPPAQQPERALPPTVPAPGSLRFSVDSPADQADVYFNPLVPLWHRFRAEQVVAYLRHFEARLDGSCLSSVPLYTHQITPFTNPSWDASKFAVEASLEGAGRLRLGVSLYGETTYGLSFLDWFAASGRPLYGVTEFHPLRAVDAAEARPILDRHARAGARFVSFFLETRGADGTIYGPRNPFAFDPDNPAHGSDRLYGSMKTLVRE